MPICSKPCCLGQGLSQHLSCFSFSDHIPLECLTSIIDHTPGGSVGEKLDTPVLTQRLRSVLLDYGRPQILASQKAVIVNPSRDSSTDQLSLMILNISYYKVGFTSIECLARRMSNTINHGGMVPKGKPMGKATISLGHSGYLAGR